MLIIDVLSMLPSQIRIEKVHDKPSKKKKCIPGCLKESDLTEAYRCEKKTRRRSGGDKPIQEQLQFASVKAVEFQEAIIEQILPPITESIEPQDIDPKTASVVLLQYEVINSYAKNLTADAVARYTVMNSVGDQSSTSSGRRTLSSSSSSELNPFFPQVPDNDLSFARVPDNNLSFARVPDNNLSFPRVPDNSTRGSPIVETRKVAFHLPNLNGSECYEPENSLQRVSRPKTATMENVKEQSSTRQRRSGLAKTAPLIQLRTAPPGSAESFIYVAVDPNNNDKKDVNVAQALSPIKRSSSHALLAAIKSVQERLPLNQPTGAFTNVMNTKNNIDIHQDDCAPRSAPLSPTKRTTSLTHLSSKDALTSRHRRPNSLISGSTVNLSTSFSDDDEQRKPSLSPSAGHGTGSSFSRHMSSLSKSMPSLALTASHSSRSPQRTRGLHSNATRYWDWYLLNCAYSWQNFNLHKYEGF